MSSTVTGPADRDYIIKRQLVDSTGKPVLGPVAVSTDDTVESEANAAAVLTYAAVEGKAHVIYGLDWSFSADPTADSAPTITMEDGAGNVVWGPHRVISGGPGFHTWPYGKRFSVGKALIIKLAAGGESIIGTLSASVKTE